MEENLVGYLLGTLDPVTHRQVEAYLRCHPEGHAQLEMLEQALSPLAEDAQAPVPPPGLVQRVLARLSEQTAQGLPAAPRPSPQQVGAAPRRWFRRPDVAVAASLLLLLAGLGGSWLVGAWNRYQRVACADNLRRFWGDLQAYSDRGEGEFPRVEASGPRSVAGVFVPVLHDAGLVREVSVVCPAQGQCDRPTCSVRDLEAAYHSSPEQFEALAGSLAGNYAYCLGYQENGVHLGLGRTSGDRLPIMADRSGPEGGNSCNHGGAGQNVLYVGGAVRWCVQPNVGVDGDDIYLNRRFRIGAGVQQADTVLGASDARPYE
jgi:hypothetical protein